MGHQWDQSLGGWSREEVEYLFELRIVFLSIHSASSLPGYFATLCFYFPPTHPLQVSLSHADRGSFLAFEVLLAFLGPQCGIFSDHLASAAP